MLFEYSYYKDYLFYGALLELFIGIFLFVFALFNLKNNVRYRHSGTVTYFVIILFFVISLSVLYSSLVNLKFGIYLAIENETMVTEKTGRIENIKEMKLIYVEYSEEGKVTCQLVTIDGENYLFISTGDLGIGDNIIIDYLPKSRIVLEWEFLRD